MVCAWVWGDVGGVGVGLQTGVAVGVGVKRAVEVIVAVDVGM